MSESMVPLFMAALSMVVVLVLSLMTHLAIVAEVYGHTPEKKTR